MAYALPYKQRVTGSNPVAPTSKIKGFRISETFFFNMCLQMCLQPESPAIVSDQIFYPWFFNKKRVPKRRESTREPFIK